MNNRFLRKLLGNWNVNKNSNKINGNLSKIVSVGLFKIVCQGSKR